MKLPRRYLFCLYIIIFLSINITEVYADVPYRSYSYSREEDATPSPQPYVPVKIIDGASLGIGSIKQPSDIFVGDDQKVYLVDTGNNRIICMDEKWNVLSVISEFEHDGGIENFNNPQGIFVTSDGNMYIADTDNGRIVVLNSKGEYIRFVQNPKSEVFTKDITFEPVKVAVDTSKRIYAIGLNVYDGLIEFDSEGNFLGFTGANKVTPNIAEFMWKRISTKAQKGAMKLFIPTEFNNLDVDNEGFIFTTTGTSDTKNPVRRQNAAGDNIIRKPVDDEGPVGDIGVSYYRGTVVGPSYFTDVCTQQFGIYSCLDSKRGHIFTYDSDGNLLHIFGGMGNTLGSFRMPTAIESIGDKMLVLDKVMEHITVFQSTEYGNAIRDAVTLHYNGKYDEAAEKWKIVSKLNANSEIAYVGIGRALLRDEQFAEAMKNFKLGHNRQYYSKAFKLYREQVIRKYFGDAVVIILFLSGAMILYEKVLKKRLWRGSVKKWQ